MGHVVRLSERFCDHEDGIDRWVLDGLTMDKVLGKNKKKEGCPVEAPPKKLKREVLDLNKKVEKVEKAEMKVSESKQSVVKVQKRNYTPRKPKGSPESETKKIRGKIIDIATMKAVGERMNDCCQHLGMKNEREVHVTFLEFLKTINPELGTHEKTVKGWLEGKNTANLEFYLFLLSKGIDLNYLMSGQGQMFLEQNRSNVQPTASLAPVPAEAHPLSSSVPMSVIAQILKSPETLRAVSSLVELEKRQQQELEAAQATAQKALEEALVSAA